MGELWCREFWDSNLTYDHEPQEHLRMLWPNLRDQEELRVDLLHLGVEGATSWIVTADQPADCPGCTSGSLR